MIIRRVRFSMKEEAALKKKVKTGNEKVLLLKLKKVSNLRVFYNTTTHKEVKKIIENTTTDEIISI